MSNTDKLLRVFIEAQGYEIKEVKRESLAGEEPDVFLLDKNYIIDYKVTNKTNKYKESYEKLKVTCLNAAKVRGLGLIGIMLEHAVDECEEFLSETI